MKATIDLDAFASNLARMIAARIDERPLSEAEHEARLNSVRALVESAMDDARAVDADDDEAFYFRPSSEEWQEVENEIPDDTPIAAVRAARHYYMKGRLDAIDRYMMIHEQHGDSRPTLNAMYEEAIDCVAGLPARVDLTRLARRVDELSAIA